jgi:hypothetical protein
MLTTHADVLKRRDSLAANLGAKLTGPRLLKGIDNFFEGGINIISQPHYPVTVTWSDIVLFAKSNADEFKLNAHPDGTRRCQFPCKGCQVEINEDDWRLISSGALDGLALEQSFEEDELSELATLEIIEQRASILYKKADEVAARARILHHSLGQRKNKKATSTESASATSACPHIRIWGCLRSPRRPTPAVHHRNGDVCSISIDIWRRAAINTGRATITVHACPVPSPCIIFSSTSNHQ